MVALVGGFYLLREHWNHVAGNWIYLLLLACPLMHLFHGHGRAWWSRCTPQQARRQGAMTPWTCPHATIKPEIAVMVGICTHLGCIPTFRPTPGAADIGATWLGGFYCPCHSSKFNLAGRVFKNVPAPTNLVVPPYQFASDSRLLVGVDLKA